LGTFEQCKVDVYGPVVNLAARLESMTKQFGVRVLIDDNIAEYLRTRGKINRVCRTRKLARLYPAGMNKAQTVSELLPLENQPGHAVPEKLRTQWEQVVDMFIAKKWETARPALEQLSTVRGQEKAGRMILEFMALHHNQPSADWDGVIRLEKK
jgi:adenylate cyclase